jgi:hypothetical protein
VGVLTIWGVLYAGVRGLVVTALDISCGITGVAAFMLHLRRVACSRLEQHVPSHKKQSNNSSDTKSKHARMQQEAELVFRTLSLFLSLTVSLSLQYSWRGLLTFFLFRYAGVTASINEFAQVVASRIVSKVEASTRAGMTDSGLYVISGALVQASSQV